MSEQPEQFDFEKKTWGEVFAEAASRGFPHAEKACEETVEFLGAEWVETAITSAAGFADFLSGAFVWQHSSAGKKFWEGVYREWCAMEEVTCLIDSDL